MDKLFGREKQFELLKKRIYDFKEGYRQNIAVLGDESVGKTTFIFNFLNHFQDPRVIPLYLEVRPEATNIFAKRFIASLLYNFLQNSLIPLKEDLDFLVKTSEKFIPKTINRARLLLNMPANKQNNNFGELLGLCELIYQETKKSCVVIFDEFHNLELLGFKNLYRDWSKLLISNKNSMYIIISSMRYKTKNILSKNLSLLFGNFETINIEPLDIKFSKLFIADRLPGTDSGLADFLAHFTSGFPLYLEIILETIKKSPGTRLSEIITNLLFDSSGILNQRFSNYMKRFADLDCSKDYISILALISNGRNKINDISHILKKQKKELALRVNYLLELDAIIKSGDFLKIEDRIFSFWLKFIYQEQRQALSIDAKAQKERLCKNIENYMEEFSSCVKKSVLERVTELLQLFEDETMQLEKKKLRLNHFREIKTLEFNNTAINAGLIGRCSESLWIMALKYGLLTEEDIILFSKECKKYRHKLQRKIIITLKEIDMNTKLRALEEKIWAWDLSNLNQILDLYSKPWVIPAEKI